MNKKVVYFVPSLLVGLICIAYGRSESVALPQQELSFAHIKRVFDHLNIPVTTPQEANDCGQKDLLRKPGSERWDMQQDKPWYKDACKNKSLLIQDFKDLGMIDEVEPTDNKYDYVLLMGACKGRVQDRLAVLAELKKRHITFGMIVLLGGARVLESFEKEGLPVHITTESAMMEYLCSQHADLKHDKRILVDAPMITKADGTQTRPTTDSTLVHFAQTAPHDGSCLVISNNPYVVRQTLVAQRILDQQRFPTQGAGKAASEDDCHDIVMLMDEFARTVYEFNKKNQIQ